jgi:hypothetical protein
MPVSKKVRRRFVPQPPVDRGGLAAFTHLVRAPDDPEETVKRGRGGDAHGWRKLDFTTIPEWMELIKEHMKDGERRTFNRMMVEICGRTADVCFDKNPDKALWELVAKGYLHHTMQIPIYFWAPKDT